MFFATSVVLSAERLQARGDLRLEDLADVHLRDADVAVRVALHFVQRGKVLGMNIEDDPFGDDRDAVAAPVAETLDDRADQRVDDALQPDRFRKLLGDQGQRRARRFAHARAPGARPCVPW